jgi:quinol monooxygenase YgiN
MKRREFLMGTAAAVPLARRGRAQQASTHNSESPLTVFAEFYAKAGKENELRKLLLGLIGPTRKEKGYVQYDLHADNENPAHFFFFEKWTSKALLDAHLAAPHLTAFAAKADALLAQPRRVVLGSRIG